MIWNRCRLYLEDHIGTVVVTTLVLLACLAYFGFETMERRAQERQAQVAHEQHWPTVRLELQNALEGFDRRDPSAPVDMEAVKKLEEASSTFQQLQRQFPRVYFPEAIPLLEGIRERRERTVPDLLLKKSVAAEAFAEMLLTQSQFNPELLPQALESFHEALLAQERIHQEFPNHVHTNFPRSAKLRTHIHAIEVHSLLHPTDGKSYSANE